jgi:hypothetical protein
MIKVDGLAAFWSPMEISWSCIRNFPLSWHTICKATGPMGKQGPVADEILNPTEQGIHTINPIFIHTSKKA